MSDPVDLYGTAYGNFETQTLAQVRRETYGEDFGQSSWITGSEYRRFFRLLEIAPTDRALDVACGSGGPALFLAREVGCAVTGVDINEADKAVEEIEFKAEFRERLLPAVDAWISGEPPQ